MSIENTLAIVKPDAVAAGSTGKIIDMIESNGFEIVAMKKEIHRMELRYEQLRKRQEEMIKDMERSVFKRETIQLKYLPKVEKRNA